jgi:hypothetical protein
VAPQFSQALGPAEHGDIHLPAVRELLEGVEHDDQAPPLAVLARERLVRRVEEAR